jgi:hypothetical protein
MIKRKTKKKKPEKTASAPNKLRKELDKFAASLPPMDDSAPLIRADRQR